MCGRLHPGATPSAPPFRVNQVRSNDVLLTSPGIRLTESLVSVVAVGPELAKVMFWMPLEIGVAPAGAATSAKAPPPRA